MKRLEALTRRFTQVWCRQETELRCITIEVRLRFDSTTKQMCLCVLILPHLCVLDFNTIMCIDGCVLVIKRYILLHVRA